MVLSLLFTGVIIWVSRKFISRINHNTACTTLIQWNISLAAKWHRVCRFAPGSGQNGLIPYFLIFPISLYLKNIIIYTHILWLNTCIVIVSVFLPNIMIIGWIFLTWDQFFLSYAILPRLPLYVSGDTPIWYSSSCVNLLINISCDRASVAVTSASCSCKGDLYNKSCQVLGRSHSGTFIPAVATMSITFITNDTTIGMLPNVLHLFFCGTMAPYMRDISVLGYLHYQFLLNDTDLILSCVNVDRINIGFEQNDICKLFPMEFENGYLIPALCRPCRSREPCHLCHLTGHSCHPCHYCLPCHYHPYHPCQSGQVLNHKSGLMQKLLGHRLFVCCWHYIIL